MIGILTVARRGCPSGPIAGATGQEANTLLTNTHVGSLDSHTNQYKYPSWSTLFSLTSDIFVIGIIF